MIKRLSPLVLVFLIKPSWAAPSISNFSGTFSGDANNTSASTVTITGSGFGTKSNATPLLWATFEANAEPTSLGRTTAWVHIEHGERNTSNKVSGSAGICSDAGAWTDPSNKQFYVRANFTWDHGQKWRIMWRRLALYTYEDANWKWIRVFDNYDSGTGNWYVGTQGSTKESRLFQMENNVDDPSYHVEGAFPHPAQSGAWRWEMFTGQYNSSAGAVDGYIQIRTANNTPYSSTTWRQDAATSDRVHDQIFFEHDPSGYTPDDLGCGDDIFYEDSWNLAVVGDANTFAGSTKLIPIITTSWSDNTINGYFHQADLAGGSTNYLYVCDANNSCSSAYQFAVGNTGSPGNQPPSVDAGANQQITLPSSANLDGTVSDDVAVVGSTWTKVSGSGNVTFGNANAVDTTASFDAADTYVLQLAASDGEFETTDTTTITVNAEGGGGGNGSGKANIGGKGRISGKGRYH